MPAAEPQGTKRTSWIWVVFRRVGALVTGLLDMIDLLVFAGLALLVLVALLLGAWQSAVGRFVIVSLLVIVPILFAIRVRST